MTGYSKSFEELLVEGCKTVPVQPKEFTYEEGLDILRRLTEPYKKYYNDSCIFEDNGSISYSTDLESV